MAPFGPRHFLALLPSTLAAVCFYCGEPSSCRDHPLPWATFGVAWWLPACTECNLSLSDAAFPTLGARARRVREALQTKHRRALGRDCRERLAGTKGRVRLALLAESSLVATVRQRLAWADAVALATAELPTSELYAARAQLASCLTKLLGRLREP